MAPQPAPGATPKPNGGIRIVRAAPPAGGGGGGKPPLSPAPAAAGATPAAVDAKLRRVSLDEAAPAAAAGPLPDEAWEEFVAAAGGDAAAAAAAVAASLAAGSPAAAAAAVGLARARGAAALHAPGGVAAALEGALAPGGAAAAAAAAAVAGLARADDLPGARPLLLRLLPAVLDVCSDRAQPTRKAARAAGAAVVSHAPVWAAAALLAPLVGAAGEARRGARARAAALALAERACRRAPRQAAARMSWLVDALSAAMTEPQPEVAAAAEGAALAAFQACGNRDLEPHVPALVSCIARPDEAAAVVARLSATTFVQAVEAPALAAMVPLLARALRERSATSQRRACIIISNMARLVLDPADAAPFVPLLLPALQRVADEAADPELRDVGGRAAAGLAKIRDAAAAAAAAAPGGGAAAARDDALAGEAAAAVRAALAEALGADAAAAAAPAVQEAVAYVAQMAVALFRARVRMARAWDEAVAPPLAALLEPAPAAAAAAAAAARGAHRWAAARAGGGAPGARAGDDDTDADGPELCDCEFSLAYGGRILLTQATLRLRRGRRYGLCGANGAGKSTLMRAIAAGQLEGFPPPSALRTVYVEHDIDASEDDVTAVGYVHGDAALQAATAPSEAAVAAALEAVGFTPELRGSPVRALSGGWKMKLALARAQLLRADVLLLDEPTNHLDAANVAWLTRWLTTADGVSSVIVSHDPGFLEAVCTDIIHYEAKKLVHYRGTLSEFVARKPEAKAYYELASATLAFKFPRPGFLDGIRAKTQAVLRLSGVGFAYPGAPRRQLEGVAARVTMGSRIAVLGPNGAGKSTLIKLMTGELAPDEGTIWKHPNLRVAYVAQHAFHHIEEHLEKTPAAYLWWRFGSGDGDREAAAKATRRATQEEAAARAAAAAKGERVVAALLGRRQGRKEKFEYEVQFEGLPDDFNRWLPRSELDAFIGAPKMAEALDARLAVGLTYRPMSTAAAVAHLADFGLDEELVLHNAIRGMSGGQKVKLVLGAAMWQLPHMVVLDEPTNYLDRDSLGALAAAIRGFEGAVVMISHNAEFTGALSNEEWHVGGGRVVVRKEGGGSGAGLGPSASCASLASLPTTASAVSLASMADTESSAGAAGGGGDGDGDDAQDGDEELSEQQLEERLAAKRAARAEKLARAAEKKAAAELKKKLRYARKF